MSRIIKNYTFFVLLSSLCSVVVGMEKQQRTISFGIRNLDSAMDQQLCVQKLKKGKIPVLALNNYVMKVSTAYQALKKEASFEQDILHDMIYRANKRMRKVHQKEGIIYRVPDAKVRKRMEGDSCFRWAEIEYHNKLGPKALNEVSAHVTTSVLCYCISASRMQPFNYFTYQRALQDCNISVKKDLVHWLSKKNTTVFVELYSPGQISDWIKITNHYKPVRYNDTIRSPRRLLQPFLEEGSLFHAQDLDYNATDVLDFSKEYFSFIVGAMVAVALLKYYII